MLRLAPDPSVGDTLSAEIGKRWHAGTFRWESRDAMLYALSVGAGSGDPQFTTENTEGVDQRVLPTFCVLMQDGDSTSSPVQPYIADMLHAEQFVSVPSPLPVSGVATIDCEVVSVFDKGRDALVVIESLASDAVQGVPLATMTSSVFIGGAGGFDGVRGPTTTWERPARRPDETLQFPVAQDLALLYRLNGDRNPLHSDPAVARRAGFSRPILHGLCTFGIAGRVLLDATADSEVERFRSMAARFTRPVLPGDIMDVLAWVEARDVIFQVLVGGQIVLDRGRLSLS